MTTLLISQTKGLVHTMISESERGREGGREGEREGEREGGKERGREGER